MGVVQPDTQLVEQGSDCLACGRVQWLAWAQDCRATAHRSRHRRVMPWQPWRIAAIVQDVHGCSAFNPANLGAVPVLRLAPLGTCYGCRYKQGHASDHWQESAHCYALELETQRVWDYAGGHSSSDSNQPAWQSRSSWSLHAHHIISSTVAQLAVCCLPPIVESPLMAACVPIVPVVRCRHTWGPAGQAVSSSDNIITVPYCRFPLLYVYGCPLTGDGYVHRLIQSKTDGKLVEVPSPAPACRHTSPGHHHHRCGGVQACTQSCHLPTYYLICCPAAWCATCLAQPQRAGLCGRSKHSAGTPGWHTCRHSSAQLQTKQQTSTVCCSISAAAVTAGAAMGGGAAFQAANAVCCAGTTGTAMLLGAWTAPTVSAQEQQQAEAVQAMAPVRTATAAAAAAARYAPMSSSR